MRKQDRVFHLAIPCRELDEAKEFYVDGLGCRLARRRDDRITLDFFGDQVVCHLCPEGIDEDPKMYPRHFGITFENKKDYDELLAHAENKNLPFFAEPFVRFKGEPSEHWTFLLRDPSNNLLEFKYYADSVMMY